MYDVPVHVYALHCYVRMRMHALVHLFAISAYMRAYVCKCAGARALVRVR